MKRKFKVMQRGCFGIPAGREPGSELRFRGQWVQRAGFHPGAPFVLSVISPGVIEIRLAHTEPPAEQALRYAVQERLDRACVLNDAPASTSAPLTATP